MIGVMTQESKYPSDLTDAQWKVIEAAMPPGIKSGRPRLRPARQMLNAILYVQKTGCQWRQLPHDFPPWKQVYNTFWRWRQRGVWDKLLAALRGQLRQARGRNAQPSVAIIDSQSVKTVSKGGSAAGMRAKRSMAANAILP